MRRPLLRDSQGKASLRHTFANAQVHLQTAKSLPEIRDMISKQKEVFINLDQSPTFMHHFGQELPVILASLNNMWAILQDRPLTAGAARPASLSCRVRFHVVELLWNTTDYRRFACRMATAEELASAQLIPVYERAWKCMGFEAPPLNLQSIGQAHLKQMAGNSFHQGCFVAWMCFVLAKLKQR